MKKILRQVVAADVDQKNLVITLGRLSDTLEAEIYASKVFSNNAKGFAELLSWVEQKCDLTVETRFVMEATGVYHESFAYYLDERNKWVSVVLPNKISNYFRTLEVKTVTDKTSSEAIARFALERNLSRWHRPDPVLGKMKQLSRERDQLIAERTLIKNQLHAEKSGAEPYQPAIVRMKKRIKMLDQQEKEIQEELATLIEQNDQLAQQVELICTIPGVGRLTAAIVLAETNGFELIRNKRQLVSYAGLDVREKLSGTSVHGKPRISKRGNKHLRKALHMPALSAIRFSETHKNIFVRLVSKHGIKMKAAVAVQRKILELIYIIHKTKRPYDPEYHKKNGRAIQSVTI